MFGQMRTSQKKKRIRLNPRRTKLIRLMAQGKNLSEAGKEAGYSCRQAASNALRQVRVKMPGVLDKAGLTDDVLVSKYLQPLMNAKKTLFFQHRGIVLDKRRVADLGIRLSALDTAFKLKGSYAPVGIEHDGTILHVLTETEKKEAEES